MLMAHDESTKQPRNVISDSAGRLLVALAGSAGAAAIQAAGASFAATVLGMVTNAANYVWDGSNWIRAIGDSAGQIRVAGHTTATDSNRGEEIDPLSAQHLEDVIAEVTNGADDTYDYYVDMDGFSAESIHLVLNGGSGSVTVKLYGSGEDNGTAAASVDEEDIGMETFGAASWTASEILNDVAQALGNLKWLHIEVVASTGAADDADWTIFGKQKQ